MAKYGDVAVEAVRLVRSLHVEPPEAWRRAVVAAYPNSIDSQTKGCPRGAFLGLCQEGLIAGVPAGNYTRSDKNKRYALRAAQLLRENTGLASDAASLWRRVLAPEVDKRPNHQMEVVLSLWNAGYLVATD